VFDRLSLLSPSLPTFRIHHYQRVSPNGVALRRLGSGGSPVRQFVIQDLFVSSIPKALSSRHMASNNQPQDAHSECLAVGHLRVRPAPRGDGRRGGAASEPQELVDYLRRLYGGGVLQYGQDGGHAAGASYTRPDHIFQLN